MLDVFKILLPLFLVIGLGAFLKAIKLADEEWIKIFNKYSIYIGLPALLLANTLNINLEYFQGWDIIFYNALLILAVIGLTFLIAKWLNWDKSLRNTYLICIFFGNIAFLGIPVVSSIYWTGGASLSLQVISYILILFIVGIAILESSTIGGLSIPKLINKVLRNPLFITSLVCILLMIFQVRVPAVINQALMLVAATATPVALMALGMFIYRKVEFDHETTQAIILSALKLVAVPLIFFAFAYLTSLKANFNISIIEAAMPIAVTPFALAEIYSMNKNIIALSILISTIASIITLPIIITVIS